MRAGQGKAGQKRKSRHTRCWSSLLGTQSLSQLVSQSVRTLGRRGSSGRAARISRRQAAGGGGGCRIPGMQLLHGAVGRDGGWWMEVQGRGW